MIAFCASTPRWVLSRRSLGTSDIIPLRHMNENLSVHGAERDCGCVRSGNIVVGCPVAGRTSPAAPLADLHRSSGHGVGLTIPIVSPPGARQLHISFHRNTHGFTMGCEPSWGYEASLVWPGCPDRRLKVWYDEHKTLVFSLTILIEQTRYLPLFALLCASFLVSVRSALIV